MVSDPFSKRLCLLLKVIEVGEEVALELERVLLDALGVDVGIP